MARMQRSVEVSVHSMNKAQELVHNSYLVHCFLLSIVKIGNRYL